MMKGSIGGCPTQTRKGGFLEERITPAPLGRINRVRCTIKGAGERWHFREKNICATQKIHFLIWERNDKDLREEGIKGKGSRDI